MPLTRGRLLLLEQVKEKDWREQVLTWARRTRWRCYFTWRSDHSPAGFPDLVLCRPPRVLFIELKTEGGDTSGAQDDWGWDLCQCEGVEYYLWRPHDEEQVLEVLK